MGNYHMGENANGQPFEEEKFYTHITNGRIVQLFRDAAGFREVENGRNVNIFNLSDGKNYRPATESDFQTEIEACDQRSHWLKKGLESVSK